MKKILCKLLGHDTAISYSPNSGYKSGYMFHRHCLRCRNIFEEGEARL